MTERITRRDIISGALATGAALLSHAPAVVAKTFRGSMPGSPSSFNHPQAITANGYLFFSSNEVAFVEAVVDRLIPTDELGPGALEAGCVLFIDRQLAGSYGHADRWYMQGPWPEGDEQQGMQGRMSPAETYRAGIRAMNGHCHQTFGGKPFNELTTIDQEVLLSTMEKGELPLPGVNAKSFFSLLLQNTTEGFFADPLYGGNHDMIGWKLIGFPGARYDHLVEVSNHGKPYTLPPVGILGRKAWD